MQARRPGIGDAVADPLDEAGQALNAMRRVTREFGLDQEIGLNLGMFLGNTVSDERLDADFACFIGTD
jgi:hypothetical protein